MEINGKEDLKTKVAGIRRLRDKICRMELVSEVENECIRDLAETVYYSAIKEEIRNPESCTMDIDGPTFRLALANEILSEVGLDNIDMPDPSTKESIVESYLSRF